MNGVVVKKIFDELDSIFTNPIFIGVIRFIILEENNSLKKIGVVHNYFKDIRKIVNFGTKVRVKLGILVVLYHESTFDFFVDLVCPEGFTIIFNLIFKVKKQKIFFITKEHDIRVVNVVKKIVNEHHKDVKEKHDTVKDIYD